MMPISLKSFDYPVTPQANPACELRHFLGQYKEINSAGKIGLLFSCLEESESHLCHLSTKVNAKSTPRHIRNLTR